MERSAVMEDQPVPFRGHAEHAGEPGIRTVRIPRWQGVTPRELLRRQRVGIVFQLGSEARLFRAILLEETNKDYVRTARAKGLSEAVVLFRHVLRNAWLPVLTHVGALLPYAFLGSIVFESFFGIPGLGTYVIEAIGGQDFAIVHTMVFLGSLLYILAYLLTDIAYTFVDPRVRLT